MGLIKFCRVPSELNRSPKMGLLINVNVYFIFKGEEIWILIVKINILR